MPKRPSKLAPSPGVGKAVSRLRLPTTTLPRRQQCPRGHLPPHIG
jgi:hypothetical protein